jgi:hypothetical protein
MIASIRIPLLLLVLGIAACGGKTAGSGGDQGSSSGGGSGGGNGGSGSGGSGGSGGNGGSSSGGASADASACVDVSPASFDTACETDGDCTIVTTGVLCTGSCNCGDTPISRASLASYEAITQSIQLGACPCPASPNPACLHGQCTACPIDDPTCGGGPDGGVSTSEASTGEAGACIYVSPGEFDDSCTTVDDCTWLTTGTLCNGSCDCGNTPANVSTESAWEAATSSITFAGCPCAAPQPLQCMNGACAAGPMPSPP